MKMRRGAVEVVVADLVRIEEEFVRLALRFDEEALRALGSGWCAAEHLLHVIKTIEWTAEGFEALRDATPTPPAISDRQRWFRRVIFATHRIPRGRPAPPAIHPEDILSRDELFVRLRRARDQMVALAPEFATRTVNGAWLRHQALGAMSFRQWVRFLLIHARHHLDILAEARAAADSRH